MGSQEPSLAPPQPATQADDDDDATAPRRFSWHKLGHTAFKVAVAGIKALVALEASSFLLERARLSRYLGRRERWGERSSDLPSSDARYTRASIVWQLLC
jgi:hypothetical protein